MDDALHLQLLAAVEEQLTSPATRYVAKTYERLLKLGLDEADAKDQIALCLGEEMDVMVRKKRSFDEKAYRGRLDELPLDEVDEEEHADSEEQADEESTTS